MGHENEGGDTEKPSISNEAKELIEEFLRGVLGVTPGFNRLILLLYLLHKRLDVSVEHATAFLDEVYVKAVKELNFLGIHVDESENKVSVRVGSPAWRLIEAIRDLEVLLEEVEWPEEVKRERLCLVKALPAVLQTLATLKSVERWKEGTGGDIAEALDRLLKQVFSKAINEERLSFGIFNSNEVDVNIANTIVKNYGKEFLDSILNKLSGLGAFNYLEEPGMIIIDPDVVEGLKKAKTECDPALGGDLSVKELEDWINRVARRLGSES